MKNQEFQETFYPESRFGGFTDVDGTIAFYTRVNALITPDSWVLDIGCGRGTYGDDPVRFRRNLRILRGKCARAIGIDLDQVGTTNPYIDEFRLITGSQWPAQDESFDLCLCDNVLEHVDQPATIFAECRRVLRPGGYLCVRTPNLLSYFGLASWALRRSLRRGLIGWAQPRRLERDVFPVRYRCNTISALRNLLDRSGFDHYVYGYEAEPSYLSMAGALYFLGVVHQRIAPPAIRVGLLAFARKRS